MEISFKSNHVGKQLIRSAFGIVGVYGFFISLRMISLTNATVLLLTMPLFVPIASRIWLKTRIPAKMWIGLSIAFVGVICIIRPGIGMFNVGALIGLIGAALGAVSMLAIRQLLSHGEPAPQIMIYVSICLSVVGLTALLLTPQTYTIDFTDEVLFYLLIVGLTTVGYQACMTYAGKYASMTVLMPFLYLSTVLALFPDYYIWHVDLTTLSLVGTALIIIGTIVKVLLFRKQKTIEGL